MNIKSEFLTEADYSEETEAALSNRKSARRYAVMSIIWPSIVGAAALFLTGGRPSLLAMAPSLALLVAFGSMALHHRNHAVWRENHVLANRPKP